MSRSVATPKHLWIIGIVTLLWNMMGAFDYLMTQTKNASYMAQFEQAQLDYFYNFPTWLVVFWALAVWGSVAGSVLCLDGHHVHLQFRFFQRRGSDGLHGVCFFGGDIHSGARPVALLARHAGAGRSRLNCTSPPSSSPSCLRVMLHQRLERKLRHVRLRQPLEIGEGQCDGLGVGAGVEGHGFDHPQM